MGALKQGREPGITKGVTPHILRRTFATRLYGQTKDLLRVQRALDHRLSGTTMRYAGDDTQESRGNQCVDA